MRVTLFAIGLVLTGFNASFAFEIEDHQDLRGPYADANHKGTLDRRHRRF